MSVQRTEEWFAARLGRATASRFADVLAKTKSGPSASRKNYLAQLVAERLTGRREQGYTSAEMQFGTDTEPLARAAYQERTGLEVQECGFLTHHELMAGASPDGLVDEYGLLEIKCPNTATHIEYLLSTKYPSKYQAQIQGQLWIADREWCDFVSFDPRMPIDLQLKVFRVERDDAFIHELFDEVLGFLNDVDEVLSKIKTISSRSA